MNRTLTWINHVAKAVAAGIAAAATVIAPALADGAIDAGEWWQIGGAVAGVAVVYWKANGPKPDVFQTDPHTGAEFNASTGETFDDA